MTSHLAQSLAGLEPTTLFHVFGALSFVGLSIFLVLRIIHEIKYLRGEAAAPIPQPFRTERAEPMATKREVDAVETRLTHKLDNLQHEISTDRAASEQRAKETHVRINEVLSNGARNAAKLDTIEGLVRDLISAR